MAAVGGSGVTGMGMIVPALPNPRESGQADRELIVGGDGRSPARGMNEGEEESSECACVAQKSNSRGIREWVQCFAGYNYYVTTKYRFSVGCCLGPLGLGSRW